MIQESHATPQEIQLVVDKIAPLLDEFPPGHAIMALLAMSCLIMNPFLDSEELVTAIAETSQFICLALDGKGNIPEEVGEGEDPNVHLKKMMN